MRLPFQPAPERPLDPAERKQAKRMLAEGYDGVKIARVLGVASATIYDFAQKEEEAAEKRAEEARKKNPLGHIVERIDEAVMVKLEAKAQSDPKWLDDIATSRLDAQLAQYGLSPKAIPGEGMGAVALERGIKLLERLLANPQGQNVALQLLQRITPQDAKDSLIQQLLAERQQLQSALAGGQPQAAITEEPQPNGEHPQLEEEKPMNLADMSIREAVERWLTLDPDIAAAECRLYADAHPEKGDLPALLAMDQAEFLQSPIAGEIGLDLLARFNGEAEKEWFGAFKAALTAEPGEGLAM